MITLTDRASAALQKFGVSLGDEGLMWWGQVPAVLRAGAHYKVFDGERLTRLTALARSGETSPADIGPRDKAYYLGALAELIVVASQEEGAS